MSIGAHYIETIMVRHNQFDKWNVGLSGLRQNVLWRFKIVPAHAISYISGVSSHLNYLLVKIVMCKLLIRQESMMWTLYLKPTTQGVQDYEGEYL